MSETVCLTDHELGVAAVVGILRRLSAVDRGRPAAYGYSNRDPWTSDIESCRAEMAVAKYLNQYWHPLAGSLDTIVADVGTEIQVRSTGQPDGRLYG